MPGTTDQREKRPGGGGIAAGGSEFVDLVVAYTKQETLGPLRGLARFVGAGAVASLSWSIGALLLLIGFLRFLQTETGSTFAGDLSWLPYLFTAIIGLAVLALAAWRVAKTPTARPATTPTKGESP